MFHCFGLTIGFMLPLISGVPVYFYPSPLHYRIVPELVYGTNATILFGTDTFLAGYARIAHAYDFRSIRYVVAGAEPVKQSTRDVWMREIRHSHSRRLRRHRDGAGARAQHADVQQIRHGRAADAGRRIQARTPCRASTEGGRLLVRGPNVMLGYLKADSPGVLQPPPKGWYDTGDIVTIDAQGFVTIKGRAKRFAKIGGEMVSLAAIEQLAAELWPKAMSAAATRSRSAQGRAHRARHAAEGRDARRLPWPTPSRKARPI